MNAELETPVPGSGLSEDFRPRFRRDALFAESADGAYLQRPGDEFRLRGGSVYRWLSSLVPHLTGEHTVGQLTDGLPEHHRAALTRLISTLAERGYVHADRRGIAGRSSPEVRERFRRQIEYVAHLAPDGDATFDAYRETRILLLGADALVTAAGTALLQNGAATVDLGEHTPGAARRLRAEAEELRASGCESTVRERRWHGADLSEEYDLVVAAGADVRQLLALGERAHDAGPLLLPLLVLGDRAVAGPLCGPGRSPCVRCLLLRQSSARPGADAARLWRDAALGGTGSAEQCPPELAGMLGTLLAFEAFRLRTGVLGAETERALVVQDLGTTESHRTELLPHPRCDSCGPRVRPAAAASRATTPYDRLFGADGALLSGYHDAELSQSPLRIGRVGLTSVDGPIEEQRMITAFDRETVDAARQRAVRAAVLCYAEQVAGRGAPDEDIPAGAADVVAGDRLSLRTGMGGDDGPRVPAVSMLDGRPRLLPAAAAYPQSFRNQARAFEPTASGAACAETFDAAQRPGLLSALGHAGLSAALRGDAFAAVARFDDEDDTGLAFLRRVADVIGQPVRLLDLPGCAPGFGCLALVGDDRPRWALGTGYRRADAAAAALRDAVGAHGSSGAGDEPDLGNPLLPGFDPHALPVAEAGPVRPPVTHEAILEELRARGADVLAVDTTPCDVRRAGLVTVRVLLGEGPC